eukprot:87806_1
MSAATKLKCIANKSNEWNNARNDLYQSIYSSIKASDLCSSKKYRNEIGIVADAIMAKIAEYTTSIVTVLICGYCSNEINSYEFEMTNKSNKNVCTYYISADRKNQKIFCTKCTNADNGKFLLCDVNDCQILDCLDELLECEGCSRYICYKCRGQSQCNGCQSLLCPDCLSEDCDGCGTELCEADECAHQCNVCEMDNWRGCWFCKKCIQKLKKCDNCDETTCEWWKMEIGAACYFCNS